MSAGENPPLPLHGERLVGMVGIDLAGEPVAVEDAVGEQARRDAVADRKRSVDRRVASTLERILKGAEEAFLGSAGGDEDDQVGLLMPLGLGPGEDAAVGLDRGQRGTPRAPSPRAR